jgi:all-trans-retinol 13,14-reductase
MLMWDAIVIGSGMGGLSSAAALARTGHRVLVLEQHHTLGGLTQTFSRNGFTFNVGMHCIGDMGPEGQAAHVLDWLSEGAITMAPMGPVYDTIHLPDGFEIAFSRPEEALKLDLKEKFPDSVAEIDRFFRALHEAAEAAQAVYAQRAMPEALATIYRFWKGSAIRKWCARTTQEVLEETIADPRLRAVLAAQWGDYGGPPAESAFAIHALVMRHFFGAYYPVGGASVFAGALGAVIEKNDGELAPNSLVTALLVDKDAVVGVRLADGTEHRAPRIISDAGVLNTVGQLLPAELRRSQWAQEVLSFKPAVAHIGMYLGFEGDIKAQGATLSNHWFYETWEPGKALWNDPFNAAVAPSMFVSFPSLKDPQYDPGSSLRHTAEIVVLTRGDVFERWADSRFGSRPAEYETVKGLIEKLLLRQFGKHFPALAPLIRYHEISTPLTTAHFTHAPHGAIYGLETTPRRFLSASLNAKTPVPGLYLAGQDVGSPGVVGAMMGGLLAAASIDPKVFRLLS